jgi:plasmid stabilization system protein ParE
MNRKVVISKTAEKKLEKLLDYLLHEWSEKVTSNFIKKLDLTIQIIKEQSEIFPESQKNKGLRKCVVTKQTTLFYRFDQQKIIIVTIFDTRQHPKKLKKDL